MWSKSESLEIKDLRSRNDVKDEIVQLMTQAYPEKEEEIPSALKRRQTSV